MFGCMKHEIPVFVRAHLFKTLGNPIPNAQEYFSRVEIEALKKGRRAIGAVAQKSKDMNERP